VLPKFFYVRGAICNFAVLKILTFDFKRGYFNIAGRGHYYFALTAILEKFALCNLDAKIVLLKILINT